MNLKTKILIYNFLAFAVLFFLFRYTIYHILPLSGIWLGLVCAILASILAPKFIVETIKGKEKVFVKWIFSKGVKEL